MPGGKTVIIGRVAVKVVPDTTEFKERTEAKLKGIPLEPVEVEVNPDLTNFKRQLQTELRAIESSLRDIQVGVDVDQSELQSAIADLSEIAAIRLEVDNDYFDNLVDDANRELSKITIRPDLDERQLREIRSRLVNLFALENEIQVSLNETQVRAEAARLQRLLDRVQAEIEVELDSATAVATEASLNVLARTRRTRIEVDIDRRLTDFLSGLRNGAFSATGIGFVTDQFRGFLNVLQDLGNVAPQVAKTSLIVAGIGSAALTAVAGIFSLGNSLAEITPTLLTLPGLFAGAATGLGITIAALKDFNKELPSVGQKLTELQDLISRNFFDEFRQPFLSFFTTVFPTIRREIGLTATTLGGFFGDLATSFKKALTPEIIKSFFGPLRESIEIFGKSTDAIARSIVNLFSLGAQYLPRLAGFVGDLIEKFDRFLNQGIKDGSIFDSIDQGLRTLRALGGALDALFGIFRNIGKAAREALNFDTGSLKRGLRAIEEFTASEKFVGPFKQAIKGAKDVVVEFSNTAGDAIGRFFKALAQILGKSGGSIGRAIGTLVASIANAFSDPRFIQGAITFFSRLESAARSAAPGIEAIGKVLGPLLEVFGSVNENIGKLVGVGSSTSSSFGPLLEAIDGLVRGFGELLDDILPIIQPALGSFAEGFTEVLNAASPLIDEISDLAQRILPVLIPILQFASEVIFTSLAAAIDGVVQAFSGLNQIIDGVVAIFSGDFSGVVDIVKGVFNLIVGVVKAFLFGTFAGLIKGGVGRIIGLFGSGLGKLGGVVSKAFGKIPSLVGKILDSLGGLLKRLGGKAADLLGQGLSKLPGLVSRIFGGLGRVISSLFGTLSNIFKNGAQRAAGFVSSGFEKIVGFGKSLASRLGSAIRALWSKISNLFSSGVDNAARLVKSLATRVVSLLRGIASGAVSAIKNLWTRLSTAFENGITKVKDKVKKFISKVVGFFTSLGPEITAAGAAAVTAATQLGQDIIDAIKNAIKSGVSGILSEIKDLGSSVAGAVGGILEAAGGILGKGIAGVGRGVGSTASQVAVSVGQPLLTVVDIFRSSINKLEAQVDRLGKSDFDRLEGRFGRAIQAIDRAAKGSELPDFIDNLQSRFEDLSDEIKDSAIGQRLKNALQNGVVPILRGLGNQFERINELISIQSERLSSLIEEARSYAESVRDAIKGFANVVSVVEDSPTTFESIRDNLRASVAEAIKFAKAIKDLQRQGLNSDLLQQIIDAGSENGLAVATAILDGGASGIAELNALQGQLEEVATSTGDFLATQLYKAQIDSAQGLLDGLIQQRESLITTMRDIYTQAGDAIDAALKKAGDNLINQLITGLEGLAFGSPVAGGGGGAGGNSANPLPTGGGSTPTKGPDISKLLSKTETLLKDSFKGGVDGPERRQLRNLLETYTDLGDAAIKKVLDGKSLSESGSNKLFDIFENIADSVTSGSKINNSMSRSISQSTTNSTSQTVIYNAAPNNSLSSEQDLFRALATARMV